MDGINFNFSDDEFYVEYKCSREVGNLRQEFDRRAINLYSNNSKLILSFSSGLDSQAVLHSFQRQGIPLEVAFFYYIGYNNLEYKHLKILEKKYNFKSLVVELNLRQIKDEVLLKSQETQIPPFHIIHGEFLKKLPKDYDFIQGFNGPDFYVKNGKSYVLESANSVEISRLRALLDIPRQGKIIAWERTGEMLLSLLKDEITQAFFYSYNYIANNGLTYNNGRSVYPINFWDIYLKPFFYGKYWQDELEYFPKYQGPENVDWIMDGMEHHYENNLIAINYHELKDHLSKADGKDKRFYQRKL